MSNLKVWGVQVEVLWPEIRSVSNKKSHIRDITSCPAPAPLASVSQCNMLFIIFRLFVVFVKNEVCSWSLLSIFSDKSAPFSKYYDKISFFLKLPTAVWQCGYFCHKWGWMANGLAHTFIHLRCHLLKSYYKLPLDSEWRFLTSLTEPGSSGSTLAHY